MADNSTHIATPINDQNMNTPASTRRGCTRRTPPPSAASTRSSRSGATTPSSEQEVDTLSTSTENADPLDPAEEENGLPGYLLHTIGRLELLSLDDVEEETNEEVGDGGDSDVEGDDLAEHDGAMNMAISERLATIVDEDGSDIVNNGESNYIELRKGSHPKLHIPGIPNSWVPTMQKMEKGALDFDAIDNPGRWCNFTFRPGFASNGGVYTKHTLSTGATPVPEVDGKCSRGPWEFHYQGFKGEGSFWCCIESCTEINSMVD